MEKEYEVLEHIAQDSSLTQRKLAEKSGLSLGAINLLIKRLIKKGLIKVEQMNNRTLRYMLTPAGMVEKTKKTYEYIVYSYNYVTALVRKIKEVLIENNNVDKIYLYGNEDEIYEIITKTLIDLHKKWEVLSDLDIENINHGEKYFILIWDVEKNILFKDKVQTVVNILEV